jgi:hypothetical protein
MELRTVELCIAAVKHFSFAMQYVPEAAKTPELCRAAAKHGLDHWVLKYIPAAIKTPEFYEGSLDKYRGLSETLPEEILSPDYCLRVCPAAPYNRRDGAGIRAGQSSL